MTKVVIIYKPVQLPTSMDWFLHDNGLRHERVKNRSKWASAEMYLKRFSTAFRTATIKSKMIVKQLLVEYSQNI